MNIMYNDRADLLYIRLDDNKQHVINKRIADNIVLDIGDHEKIVGIEIMNASLAVDLTKLLPVEYQQAV